MTIDATALPVPARVEFEDGAVFEQSQWQQLGILRTRFPDAANRPQLLTLHYEDKHGAVCAVVRAHYAAWCNSDFDWTMPGASNSSRFVHRAPPTIDWTNPASATARVYLEEVLAHD